MKLALSSQSVSIILITLATAMVVVAYLHTTSDAASRGQVFTFAGGIVTGAFAFLNRDQPEPPPGTAIHSTQQVDTPASPKPQA